jgi:hypothetical protein
MPTKAKAHQMISMYYLEYARQLDRDFLIGSQRSAEKFSLEWKSIQTQFVCTLKEVTGDHAWKALGQSRLNLLSTNLQ